MRHVFREVVFDLLDLSLHRRVALPVRHEDHVPLPQGVVVGQVVIAPPEFLDADRDVDEFARPRAVQIHARRDDVDEHGGQLQPVADHPHEARPLLRQAGPVVVPQIVLLRAVVPVHADVEPGGFLRRRVIHAEGGLVREEAVPQVQPDGHLVHVPVFGLHVGLLRKAPAVHQFLRAAVQRHLFRVRLRPEFGVLQVGIRHVDGLDEPGVDELRLRRQLVDEQQQIVPARRVGALAVRTDLLPALVFVDQGPEDVLRLLGPVVAVQPAEVQPRQQHEPFLAGDIRFVRFDGEIRHAVEQPGLVVDQTILHGHVHLGMDPAPGHVEKHAFQHGTASFLRSIIA